MIITWPLFQAFDENGDPLVGGLVYTYDCGGVIDKATYSNAAMTVANANPVVLNARGEADIYAAGCTHLVITTALGVAVEETDYYGGNIATISDTDGDTQIQVEESPDEDIIRFDINGTEQITLQDGSLTPTTNNDIDLGSNSLRFKSIFTNIISGHPFPGFLQRPKFTYVESLDYDGGTALFAVGETVTGAGAATGVVVALSVGATAATGTLYINTRNETAYVNDEVLTGSVTGAAVADGASVKNAIVISPFVYCHAGTTEQLLYSDSNIAYEFTSLADGDWSYLYFDDSAIVTAATNLITANELIDNVDEPLYNVSKHGSYHQTTLTNDMCFFAVKGTTSDAMYEFFHDGGDYVSYVNYIADITSQDVDAAWVDAESAFTIPKFSTKANVCFEHIYGDTEGDIHWRPNGATTAGGQTVAWVSATSTTVYETTNVITDSSQLIEMKIADSTNTVNINTNGWYFPNGM